VSGHASERPKGDQSHDPEQGLLPEFSFEVAGEVPLADVAEPLLRVQFKSSRATAAGARLHWDFGDGQVSDLSNPVHVYLHPGLYTVKLTARGGMNPVESTATGCRSTGR